MSSHLEASSYVEAATVAGRLATAPEVTERWSAESACEGMTVGGLAHHLAGQAANTVRLLGEPGGPDPIPLLEHYRRARWVRAGLDEEFNTSIRDGSNEQAAGGPDALAEQVRRDLGVLPGVLADRREPDTVLIPWQGWSLPSSVSAF